MEEPHESVTGFELINPRIQEIVLGVWNSSKFYILSCEIFEPHESFMRFKLIKFRTLAIVVGI